MTDFCCTPELDDLHRLLPSDILAEIGVADVVVDHTTARCCHVDAVHVEALAAHLSSVLDLASTRHQRQLPPTARPRAGQGCGRMNGAGANAGNGGAAYYDPALGKKGLVFDFEAMQRAHGFVQAELCAGALYHSLPPRRHGSAGTGVFLPRAEAYQTKASRQARLSRKEAPTGTMMLKVQRQ
ncbi:unnamed protein product [Alopecurus aequalis]